MNRIGSLFSKLFKSSEKESGKKAGENSYLPQLQVGDDVKMYLHGIGWEGTIRKRNDRHAFEAGLKGLLMEGDVRLGDEATLYYFHNNRNFGVIVEILSIIEGETETTLEFLCKDRVERNQHRQYFRLPLRINVFYRMINEDGTDDPEQEYIEGFTLDISGGGMRIKSSARLAVGTKLQCLIKIGDDLLPVSAKVIRKRALSYPGEYEVGITFNEISESARNRIIRYIFSEQRKFACKETEI